MLMPSLGSNVPKGTIVPENAATIDHVYDKFDARRYADGTRSRGEAVLSCRLCNQARGEQQHKRAIKTLGRDTVDRGAKRWCPSLEAQNVVE